MACHAFGNVGRAFVFGQLEGTIPRLQTLLRYFAKPPYIYENVIVQFLGIILEPSVQIVNACTSLRDLSPSSGLAITFSRNLEDQHPCLEWFNLFGGRGNGTVVGTNE